MQKFSAFVQGVLTPLAVLMLAAVVLNDHFYGRGTGGNPMIVDGRALGRSFAPTVTANLGDAWLAAADALEQGKTMTEAQTALQTAWQESRIKAFTAKVAPEFIKVLPEGQEPASPSNRAEVVKLWRDFAAGLKGGR